jgi:hypothetical protein
MGQSNYSAAKAGVIGFAKALAQENANKGVTVNVIAPGYIATEMVKAVPEEVLKLKILPVIPVGRLGEAEEIARSVLYLAADEAGFITGSTLSVNGASTWPDGSRRPRRVRLLEQGRSLATRRPLQPRGWVCQASFQGLCYFACVVDFARASTVRPEERRKAILSLIGIEIMNLH